MFLRDTLELVEAVPFSLHSTLPLPPPLPLTSHQDASEKVSQWEQDLFDDQDPTQKKVRHMRVMARKLHLVPGDKALHQPKALADQAEYFYKQGRDLFAAWVSPICVFSAFDMLCAHVLPMTASTTLNALDRFEYRTALLDPALVQVNKASILSFLELIDVCQTYESLLGDYQTGISAWVKAMMTEKTSERGHGGVFDMMSFSADQEIESIVMGNVGVAVLALKAMLTVSNARKETEVIPDT